MSNFGFYSQYYDLLYYDKDYAAEVDYVCALLHKYTSNRPCKTILELGSGTGIHAELMSRRGLSIHGVELSHSMLDAAKQRSAAAGGELFFAHGDARHYRAGKKFDAVMSLFHVLSYQARQEDLRGMLQTASEHLDEGGLFVFDFWYGPAVLWQRPALRVKRLENEHVSVVRIAEPVLHDAVNVVDVNYTIYAEGRLNGQIEKLQETHRMRYFFMAELDEELNRAGFSRLVAQEWLSGATPSKETWGVTMVARRAGEKARTPAPSEQDKTA
jgi:SAM-dependent methyltransferase